MRSVPERGLPVLGSGRIAAKLSMPISIMVPLQSLWRRKLGCLVATFLLEKSRY
jgi:hypothetical protein